MKKKLFQKKNLSLECEDDSALAGSIYSEIGPDGLKFLKDNIKVSKEGLHKTTGDSINFQPICMEQIQIINKHLGRGASGTVQEGIYKPLNTKVAIKSINAYDKEKRHQLMNDIKILLQNKINAENNGYYCQFLVSLYGAFYDDGSVKIVLELMDAGSIGDILRIYKAAETRIMLQAEKILFGDVFQGSTGPIISEPILAKISQQILNGLSYLHVISHQIHRDIKPDNVLLSTKGYVKLTDFGISRDLEQSAFCTTVVGTFTYMSPERIEGKKYNHISDIWSFGIMLYEMGTGRYPYTSTKTYIEMLQQVINEPSPSLPENLNCSKPFRDFLNLCLQKNPKNRPSAAELLSHPWILQNFTQGPSISEWLKYVRDKLQPKVQQKVSKPPEVPTNLTKVEQKLTSNQIQVSSKDVIDKRNDTLELGSSHHSLRLTKDRDGILTSIQI